VRYDKVARFIILLNELRDNCEAIERIIKKQLGVLLVTMNYLSKVIHMFESRTFLRSYTERTILLKDL